MKYKNKCFKYIFVLYTLYTTVYSILSIWYFIYKQKPKYINKTEAIMKSYLNFYEDVSSEHKRKQLCFK